LIGRDIVGVGFGLRRAGGDGFHIVGCAFVGVGEGLGETKDVSALFEVRLVRCGGGARFRGWSRRLLIEIQACGSNNRSYKRRYTMMVLDQDYRYR
jgi:hypothetical protein